MGGTLKEAVGGGAGIGIGARRLPRGKHGIPHELIVADQRRRLLEAAIGAISERGYASLAVSELTRRAGVSRATFYELFADKHDCALEAQAWAVENLRSAIAASSDGRASAAGWPAAVAAGVGAALEFGAANPGQARLVLASVNSPSEPRLAGEGLALQLELCAALREGAGRRRGAPRPDGLGDQAAVGAALSIAGNCLAAGRLEELPRLRSEIVRILLAPFVGAAEAKRVAGDA